MMLPFNPFSVLTSKIFGGIALALLVFAGVQTYRIGSLKGDIEALEKDNAQYELKLQTSNKSIESLMVSISVTKKSIEAAQVIQASKRKASQEALTKAKKHTRGLESQINAIRAESLTSDGLCRTPSIILNTEGL
jgi:hypothetical protein